ncbi:hypothetical protein HG535_0A07970 [Zygotorulaspora mrakii]|uniref:Activator of C kinase protein 1 n=1 Tax=Zygotorulaspora mrakii TaxID=42260 RepID=A0A7H9AZ38_ZYGMR|nr:uncharacterized protein HG535_0A07970 [Zygotorulaspora mrakii]QLG70852.1 hypothetical protein HG535_0A07970 [Zygotorulaspora mrakii]
MCTETSVGGMGNPIAGPTPGSIHPYKKYLLQSQNFTLEGSGYPITDVRSPSPAREYASSPGLSNEQLSEYGSALSLNNPSKPMEDPHSKWVQSIGAPPSGFQQEPGQVSSSPTARIVNEDFQRVSSLPSVSSIQRPASNTSGSSNANNRKSRSIDLSHMYLLNSSMDTQLTATNESVADLSHQLISRYLGEGNTSTLLPRLKTIEMYRENVKKSKDVKLLFQYAQYILQTALTIDPSEKSTEDTAKELDQGEVRRKFLKEAQHYLKKLSVKGYADAQYLLGDVYASGAMGKIENKESFTLFQAAAKHGHVESAYRTAYCYEEGLGTTRDSRKALDFLKFAASRNHPSAMFKLGLYCFSGRMGLPSDLNTKQNGIKWLSRASARANDLTCAAPYELAKIYEQGFLDIVIPDQKYAMELYIQSASLGYRQAATLLGQIYEVGNEAVKQDTSLSVHYYTQAALDGDPVAMLGLCAWYLLGAEPAFAKDESEAFQWALRAAQRGFPKGQFTLGYFYEHGKGCEPNAENAWKWYQKAAHNEDPRAIIKMKQRPSNHVVQDSKRRSKSISTINLFKSKSIENLLNSDPSKVAPTGIFTDEQNRLKPIQKNDPVRLPRSTSPSMTLNLDASEKKEVSSSHPVTESKARPDNAKKAKSSTKKDMPGNKKTCILM